MNPSRRGEAPRGWLRYQCLQRPEPARYQPWGPLHPHIRFDASQPPVALNKGADFLPPATPGHSPPAHQQRCCWLMPAPKVPTHPRTGADPSKGSPMHWLWQCHPLPPPTAQPTSRAQAVKGAMGFSFTLPKKMRDHKQQGSRPCYANTQHTYMYVHVHVCM